MIGLKNNAFSSNGSKVGLCFLKPTCKYWKAFYIAANARIDLHLSTKIVNANVENKIATTTVGVTYQYGTLIVAIGTTMSLAFLLP
jgi:hypothetical protein